MWLPPSRLALHGYPRRSLRPDGSPNRPPTPAVDQSDLRPSGIRPQCSGPPRSRIPSTQCGTRLHKMQSRWAMRCAGTRSPALLSAAPAPRAATRRRAADERDELAPCRGRDAHFSAPPAQIRTCGFPAYGLYGAFFVKGASRHFCPRCYSILLFDPRREHSSIPTAHCRRRRAQRGSRTALL